MNDKKTIASEPLLVGKLHFIPREQIQYDERRDQLGSDVGFGVVYKGVYKGKPVAVKVIKLPLKNLTKKNLKLLNEVEHSMKLSHENFMPYMGWSHDDENVYIVSPFLEKGSLHNLLAKETLTVDQKVRFAEDIVRGLIYLHDNGVVHRDLKPSNVLINSDYTAMIYDLGIAKLVKEKEKKQDASKSSFSLDGLIERISLSISRASQSGAREETRRTSSDLLNIDETTCDPSILHTSIYPYIPPEVVHNKGYCLASDVYGFGAILFQMLTGKHPYQYETELGKVASPADILEIKKQGRLPEVPNLKQIQEDPQTSKLYMLMLRCLDKDEGNRPTTHEIYSELRSVTCKVFWVSKKQQPNHAVSLTKALSLRNEVPETEKVTIFVDSGSFQDDEVTVIDKPYTSIIGFKGNRVKGHFLTITKDNVEIDGVHFEGQSYDNFHMNVVYCSPIISRCNIRGGLLLFGDENTRPVIRYNTFTNSKAISNIMSHSYAILKNNHFENKSLRKKGSNGSLKGEISVGGVIDKTLAKGIAAGCDKKDISFMDLSDSQITDKTCKYIAQSISSLNKVTRIDFSLNNIGDSGMKFLADALMKNTTVVIIDLSDNKLGAKGGKYLAQVISSNPTIERINLSYNHLGKEGAHQLAQVISQAKSLQKMDLSYNKLGDGGVKYILNAISQSAPSNQNGTTTSSPEPKKQLVLDLTHNDTTPETEKLAAEVVAKNGHLKIIL